MHNSNDDFPSVLTALGLTSAEKNRLRKQRKKAASKQKKMAAKKAADLDMKNGELLHKLDVAEKMLRNIKEKRSLRTGETCKTKIP